MGIRVSVSLFATASLYDGAPTSNFQTDPNDLTTLVPLTIPMRNYGSELEALWQLTPNDLVGFNYNYVRSKWVDKPANYATAFPNDDRSVVPQTASTNYEHVFRFSGGSSFTARIDGRWQSSYIQYQDVRKASAFRVYQNIHSRVVGNINLSWLSSNGQYSIAGYVRNFTDKRYLVYTPQTSTVVVNWTDPRTYGVMVGVHF